MAHHHSYDEYKKEVLTCSRWLSEQGFFGSRLGTGGNVSIRIPGEDRLVITPSSVHYSEISNREIALVDFDLNQVEGVLPPSVEVGMHAAIYQNRPDVAGVVHSHQIFASIFALINEPVPALFDEVSFSLGEMVAVIPYGLSGSPALAQNVAEAVQNGCNAFVIQNHGALALGKSLKEAWRNTELLEKVCQIYYYALSTGKEITTLPDATREIVRQIRAHALKTSDSG